MIDCKPGWVVKAVYNSGEVEGRVVQVFSTKTTPRHCARDMVRIGIGDPLDIGPEACTSVLVRQTDVTQVIDISGELVVERVAEYHYQDKEMGPVQPGGPMGQPFSSRTKPISFGSLKGLGGVEKFGSVHKTNDLDLLSFITDRPRATLRSSEPKWGWA